MAVRKAKGSERIFACRGEWDLLGEIDLYQQVMTWPSEEIMAQRMASGVTLASKQVQLGEWGSSLVVGPSLPVGSEECWFVKLGGDRACAPVVEGEPVTVLESVFHGSGGAMLWQVRPRAVKRGVFVPGKQGLVLQWHDIAG